MSKYEVGQKVILRNLRTGDDREVTVTKVGRSYVYVNAVAWGDSPFRIDSGFAKGDNYSPTQRIGTAEMFDEHDRRASAEKRLRDAIRGFHWYKNLTTEQLDSISDMIEGGAR